MHPLNHILRKCTAGYKFRKSLEKINHLMYMDDIKLFAKKGKRIGKPNTNCENIQSRYSNGIWYWKIRHASNEKWQTTLDGNWTNKSSDNQNAWRKENLQILGDTGSWHHQTRGNERKNFKKNISEPENYSSQNSIAGTLSKRINTWAVPLVRY